MLRRMKKKVATASCCCGCCTVLPLVELDDSSQHLAQHSDIFRAVIRTCHAPEQLSLYSTTSPRNWFHGNYRLTHSLNIDDDMRHIGRREDLSTSPMDARRGGKAVTSFLLIATQSAVPFLARTIHLRTHGTGSCSRVIFPGPVSHPSRPNQPATSRFFMIMIAASRGPVCRYEEK